MNSLHLERMYTPLRGGVQGGLSPPAGSGGAIPSAGDPEASRPPTRVQGKIIRRKNFLVNVYCNFIVNMDHSL
jgi:hypothetical protein